MSRYKWSRLLFLSLGLVAVALTLAPLDDEVPSLTAFILVLPVVILIAVLGLAMFVGWQGGAFGALFGTGILATLVIGQAEAIGFVTVLPVLGWGIFFVATGVTAGTIFKGDKATMPGVGVSFVDEDTGLHSELYLCDRLGQELARARRYEEVFSLIYLEFEPLKHATQRTREDVLRKAAMCLANRYRSSDVICKTSTGLAFLLPATHQNGASILLTRLETQLTQNSELRSYVGASLGVEILIFPENDEEITAKAASHGSSQ